MIAEIHVHGHPHKFGLDKADTFCKIAKQKGIDCLIFTEHAHTLSNGFWTDKNIKILSENNDIIIMTGQEVSTDIGDILLYGYPQLIQKKMLFKDLQSSEQWAIVSAHPARRGKINRLNPWMHKIDAIEVMNKSYCIEDCKQSLDFAKNYDCGIVGSSDVHLNRHVGICPCYVPECKDIFDFVSYIKLKQVVPLNIRAF